MSGKTAFVFAGQGAQFYGMGKDLYEKYEGCRSFFNEAGEILGVDFKKEIFEDGTLLDKNEFCQPAIAAVCAAAYNAASEVNGIKADFLAGLSLGEYAALYASGVFTFSDLIKITRRRGFLMSKGAGGMSAILGLDADKCEKACAEASGIYPNEYAVCANFNAPGQIVISGGLKALEAAEKLALEYGAKRAVRLNVAGPFHTKYYVSAAEEFAAELAKYELGEMTAPVISNLTAAPYGADVIGTLKSHMTNPVLFQKSIEYMINNGAGQFYELGPGKALTGFIRKISKDVSAVSMAEFL